MMNKYTRNLFKKVASVALAGTMTLSMVMPVAAANGDPNLVVTPDTQYSTPIAANSEVTLGLMPANSYYQRTGFDSETDAANGLKVSKINLGADKISSVFTYGSKTVDNLFAGTVTVKGNSDVYGPASLHIVNTNNTSAGIDMTVYVEATEDVADAEGVKVEVSDLHADTYMYELGEDLTVAKAKGNSDNPFSDAAEATDSSGCAQTYPTAGDALYSLMAKGNISFTQSGGYVYTIADTYDHELSGYSNEDYTEYYGWYYCVIHGKGSNAEMVEGSDIVSASVLPVEDNDAVIWAFGTEKEANDYFADVLVMRQNGTY